MLTAHIQKSFARSCLGGFALLFALAAGQATAAPAAAQSPAGSAQVQAPFSSPTELLPAEPFVTGIVVEDFGPGPRTQPGVEFRVRKIAPPVDDSRPEPPFSSPGEMRPAKPYPTEVVHEDFVPESGQRPETGLRVREAAPPERSAPRTGSTAAQAPFSSPSELLPAEPFVTGIVLEGFGPRQ